MENHKRIKGLRKMRMRLKTRFMMIYRLFRFKKHGVPIGPPLKKKEASPSKLKADLDIVEEQEEDEEELYKVQ
jgi:hypothetical protein